MCVCVCVSCSVLQVLKAPPDFVFQVVSGPVVYTAISVVNALRRSPRATRSILYVSRVSPTPSPQYHVHTGREQSHTLLHTDTNI